MNTAMRFLTWNLRYGGRDENWPKADLLLELSWDVAALQEVSPSSWETLGKAGLTAGAVSAFDLSDPPVGRRRRGSALLARNGSRLSDAAPILGLPKPGRGVAAKTAVGGSTVAVCSWHAPNAAGEGPEAKMRGYRAFLAWAEAQSGPIIAGFDANHWARTASLELTPVVDDPRDRWFLENQFFGANPTHRLRDAYLDHLRDRPDEYEEIRRQRPEGPLAISYVRGSGAKAIPDRFDYIFISPEIACLEAAYHYDAGVHAGSDHAPVTATLRVKS